MIPIPLRLIDGQGNYQCHSRLNWLSVMVEKYHGIHCITVYDHHDWSILVIVSITIAVKRFIQFFPLFIDKKAFWLNPLKTWFYIHATDHKRNDIELHYWIIDFYVTVDLYVAWKLFSYNLITKKYSIVISHLFYFCGMFIFAHRQIEAFPIAFLSGFFYTISLR